VAAVDAMGNSSANFGVAVLDRTTGQLSMGALGATPFYSASVVKLYTVVDICTGWTSAKRRSPRLSKAPSSGRSASATTAR